MDLIYANSQKEDVGVLDSFKFDLAYGFDENNFELSTGINNHVCKEGFILYIEGTEYGGIIEGIRVETEENRIVYKGSTWHGLLDYKIIEPLKGTDENGGGVVVTNGKNLIPYPYQEGTATRNGVTFTDNGDGTITANGTNTGTGTANYYMQTGNSYLVPLPKGTYILSLDEMTGQGTYSYTVRIRLTDDNGSTFYYNRDAVAGGSVIDVTRDNTKMSIYIYVYSGVTVNNLIFKPMLRLASIADDAWKPYKENTVGDYLILSGEANAVLQWLVERMGLSKLFKASKENSGVYISEYKMNRYIQGYAGIKKMLAVVNGKVKFNFENGHVLIWAEPLIDYSMDDEFDSDQIDFVIEKNFIPVNHLICLGQGELKDRTVIHLYADADGNISKSQSFFGLEERTATFENTNAETEEELEKGGLEMFEEMQNSDSLQVSFDSTKDYDIGDIVGARENTTGIFMAKPIIKKIISIENNIVKIQHKVGE